MLYKSCKLSIHRHFDGPHYSTSSFTLQRDKDAQAETVKEQETTEDGIYSDFELKTLFENLDAVLFSADLTRNKTIQVSPTCLKVYGYTPADFYINPSLWQEVVHPDDSEIVRKQMFDLTRGNRVINRYRIISRPGEIKWLENKIMPTMKDGRLVRIDGISNDITEQVLNEMKLIENEKQLRESERKYRFIFQNNPMPMWLIDFETLDFLDVNNAAINHYGYSKEEFLSMSSLHIKPEHEQSEYVEVFKNTADHAGIWTHQKKDGSIIKVEGKVDVVNFEGRKAKLVMLNDVTERLRFEESLRESNERYELVTKATNDAIWDWNLCRNELYWSEGYAKLFGYAADGTEKNVHSWPARIHPDDVARVTNGLLKKINTPGTDFWEDEYRYIKADGSVAYIYDRGYILYENGMPVRMVGAMQDITSRKLSEQLLLEQEANLRTIFDNTASSYVFLDTKLNIVSFNQRANDEFVIESGGPLEKGRCLIDLLPEEVRDSARRHYERVLAGEKISYERAGVQKKFGTRWYAFHVLPIYNPSKDIQGILISADDITLRKNTELEKEKITRELLQRNKTLEQFAYIVSHNLRSPVANITGLCNIIFNARSMKEEEQARCMQGLLLSAKKLDEVIIDLNYILQVRRELAEPKSLVRFSAVVRDIKTSIQDLINRENVVIKTNFLEANQLFTIKSYLHSIFYNLIINSIKYRRPGEQPVIEISSKKDDRRLSLIFRDNGLGIDLESNATKIFGLYKKFHPHIEGKGMGLYMVKTQVEMLGGKIEISSAINAGTEFTIEFDI